VLGRDEREALKQAVDKARRHEEENCLRMVRHMVSVGILAPTAEECADFEADQRRRGGRLNR